MMMIDDVLEVSGGVEGRQAGGDRDDVQQDWGLRGSVEWGHAGETGRTDKQILL